MKQLESKDLASSLPVLPRLDRLDFLLQVLEEKHGVSVRNENSVVKKLGEDQDEHHCRTLSLSSALQEVHHKGTLIDRLTALENRLFKLSLELNEGNTSRSSSSKSSRHDSVTRNDNEDEKANPKEKQLQEEASTAPLSTDKVAGNAKMRRKSHRKWRLGSWLRLGCNN